MMSNGHRYTLIFVSVAKLALQSEMPPEQRLEFLRHLEKMTDATLTPAVVALVHPMDPRGWELYSAATKLGYGPQSPNLFTVLQQKFDVFADLNPSLRSAYDEAVRPYEAAYATRGG
jgi:hypothetical protein